jgi:hypothetical protein
MLPSNTRKKQWEKATKKLMTMGKWYGIPVFKETYRFLAFWYILMSYIKEIHKESCQDLQLGTYGRIPLPLHAAFSNLRI